MPETPSESVAHHELEVAEGAAGLVSKGLAAGKVGTVSGAILGISSVAPGYTLTASIGLIVASVALKMPAGTPMSHDKPTATTAITSDIAPRLTTASRMGSTFQTEWPRSPCAMSAIQRRDCSGRG